MSSPEETDPELQEALPDRRRLGAEFFARPGFVDRFGERLHPLDGRLQGGDRAEHLPLERRDFLLKGVARRRVLLGDAGPRQHLGGEGLRLAETRRPVPVAAHQFRGVGLGHRERSAALAAGGVGIPQIPRHPVDPLGLRRFDAADHRAVRVADHYEDRRILGAVLGPEFVPRRIPQRFAGGRLGPFALPPLLADAQRALLQVIGHHGAERRVRRGVERGATL